MVTREAVKLFRLCIQSPDGNHCPSVMVRVGIHHGGRSELVVLGGPLNRQRYTRLLHYSRPPWATAVFGQNFCMLTTMPDPTQHMTLLHFWYYCMWISWTCQLGEQTPLSMFGTKWGSGSETWMTQLTLCQNCGAPSSSLGLQFAKEG